MGTIDADLLLNQAPIIIVGYDDKGNELATHHFFYQSCFVQEFEFAIERFKDAYPTCVRLVFDVALNMPTQGTA